LGDFFGGNVQRWGRKMGKNLEGRGREWKNLNFFLTRNEKSRGRELINFFQNFNIYKNDRSI